MLEHVRDSVLKFKSYEITTCAIGYLRQTIMFPKNNDLMLNTRIKQVVVEVKNIMIKLETGRDSDNDKHNKHHKYTLDEALQAVSKFRVESDYSDLSDQSSG